MSRGLQTRPQWLRRLQVAVLLAAFVLLTAVMAGRTFDPPAPQIPVTVSNPVDLPANGAPAVVKQGLITAPVPGNMQWKHFTVQIDLANVPKHGGVVLQFNRVPLDTLRFERKDKRVHMEEHFFRPDIGSLPGLTSTFEYRIGSTESGVVSLDIAARAEIPVALVGRVMERSEAEREDRRTVVTAAMTYSVLSVLALVILVLHLATGRDGMLAFVWFALALMLGLMAVNGHLYQLPGLAQMGKLGPLGMEALLILATGFGVLVAFELGNPLERQISSGVRGSVVGLFLFALALALALPFLPIPALQGWLISTGSWVVLSIVALGLLVRGALRGMPFRWLIVAFTVLVIGVGVANVLYMAGVVPGLWWTERAMQISIRALAAALAVSLVSRVEGFRTALAKVEAEHSELREATVAQTQLQALDRQLKADLEKTADADLEYVAIHNLLEAARRMRFQVAGMAQFSGRRAPELQVSPLEHHTNATEWLAAARHWVENTARGTVPVANPQPMITPDAAALLVPMQISEGKHGLLFVERDAASPVGPRDAEALRSLGNLVREHLQSVREARALLQTARTDALTGALNRGHLDADLEAATVQSARTGTPLAVLFVDIDHFKRINDVHGHAAGDLCLREIARAVRSCVRGDDLFGRYGGEEFIVVSPGASAEVAMQLGERIREAVQALPIDWEGQRIAVTASIGIGTRRDRETTPAPMLDRADKALYEAKRSGRNQVRLEANHSNMLGL